jgi:hypothetical protein
VDKDRPHARAGRIEIAGSRHRSAAQEPASGVPRRASASGCTLSSICSASFSSIRRSVAARSEDASARLQIGQCRIPDHMRTVR